MRIALGSIGFVPGAVGTRLKPRVKPNASHSFVTPVQVVAEVQYSTRIHGASHCGPTGSRRSLRLTRPSAESDSPPSRTSARYLVYGLTQPLAPAVANPTGSVPPAVSVTAAFWKGVLLGLLNVVAFGNCTSCPSPIAPRSGVKVELEYPASRIRIWRFVVQARSAERAG